MIRSSVVLPEPDGPSSATSSPFSISRLDIVERDEVAERLADVFDLDTHAAASLDDFFRLRGRRARPCRSSQLFSASVTSASSVSSEATAKAAANW